jgi:hypothetical protein
MLAQVVEQERDEAPVEEEEDDALVVEAEGAAGGFEGDRQEELQRRVDEVVDGRVVMEAAPAVEGRVPEIAGIRIAPLAEHPGRLLELDDGVVAVGAGPFPGAHPHLHRGRGQDEADHRPEQGPGLEAGHDDRGRGKGDGQAAEEPEEGRAVAAGGGHELRAERHRAEKEDQPVDPFGGEDAHAPPMMGADRGPVKDGGPRGAPARNVFPSGFSSPCEIL